MIVAGILFTLSMPPAIYIFRNLLQAIVRALGLDTFKLMGPISGAAIFAPIPIVFVFVFAPVQRKLAIFAYLKWLRSFEDE